MKNNKGITLVALVITIIILLIIAGISIGVLSGNNGLLSRAKMSKTLTQIANAKEEVNLAISELVIEQKEEKNNITPKMIANTINKNNNRKVSAENENAFPTNIIYPADSMGINEKILIKVGENLEIIEAKTETGITEGNNTGTGGTGDKENTEAVNVGKVNVTITNVKPKSFTINANPENEQEIALYQYYVDGKLLYEGTEKQYIVKGLNLNTNYNVEVKVIPRTTVSVAKLQQKTTDEPVVELANKFDRYIYIDSQNGNDTTGDGSTGKPYATLGKIADSGIIEKEYSYAIILRDGTYDLTTKIFELNCNKTLNIIGNKDKTTLVVGTLYGNNSIGGSTAYNINFYRLIWQSKDAMYYNPIDINNVMKFYNIIFNITERHEYSYFSACNDIYMYNCISLKTNLILRKNSSQIQLTNCYGGFTSGYATTDDMWNYKTNYITTNPKIDSTTYQITDDENTWKNVGTGSNLDGNQANLGVYGGEYSWEYGDDIY